MHFPPLKMFCRPGMASKAESIYLQVPPQKIAVADIHLTARMDQYASGPIGEV